MGSALRLSHSGRCVIPTHSWSQVVRREIVWRICGIMVLPDETERYGCVPSCPPAGIDQDGYRTWPSSKTEESGPEEQRGSGGARSHENNAHAYTIDARVSKSSGPRCEIVGRVSRRLSVHLSSCTRVLRRTCTCATLQCGTRVHTSWESLLHMWVCAKAISVHGQLFA